VHEDPAGVHVECTGGDVGVLIGRYGQTIDAVQYIVNAIVARREGERVEVTVDAAGYRERRRVTLERLAVRSAERALRTGHAVELDPMTAVAGLADARRVLLDDSLRGLELVRREQGPVVDVGAGGGAPGIPLAHALPEREFVLL